jgi:hypothetical protein
MLQHAYLGCTMRFFQVHVCCTSTCPYRVSPNLCNLSRAYPKPGKVCTDDAERVDARNWGPDISSPSDTGIRTLIRDWRCRVRKITNRSVYRDRFAALQPWVLVVGGPQSPACVQLSEIPDHVTQTLNIFMSFGVFCNVKNSIMIKCAERASGALGTRTHTHAHTHTAHTHTKRKIATQNPYIFPAKCCALQCRYGLFYMCQRSAESPQQA